MSKRIAVSAALLVLVALTLCGRVDAAPQTGWWWNPAESGRGFFVESHDGITFIGAYLYDTDGHAMWLVAGGPNDDSYNFSGQLYDKTGGQTLYGSYVAPGSAVIAGNLTVHFSDDTHGTLTWPGGTVAIERQIFGTGDPAFDAAAGWWWNADESGTGFSVEIQGSNLFMVGFMYETDGRPVWYYTAGPMNDDATYHGDLLQFANGQTIGGAYKLPASTKIGAVDIAFSGDDAATMTFTAGASAGEKGTFVKAGQSQRNTTPQFPKPANYAFPPSFFGDIGVHGIQTVDLAGAHIVTELEFSFLTTKLAHIEADRPDLYDIKETPGLIITASQTLTSDTEKCSATLPVTIVPLDQVPHQQDLALLVNHHRGYNLTFFVPPGDFSYNLAGQCIDSDGRSTPYSVPIPVTVPVGGITGAIVRGSHFGIPADVIKFDQKQSVPLGVGTLTIERFATLYSQTAP